METKTIVNPLPPKVAPHPSLCPTLNMLVGSKQLAEAVVFYNVTNLEFSWITLNYFELL